ncbi:hypothetical protein B0H63DRAFT_424987 [Podospora didyma]|uniref:Ankyrin repeat-containing protein n=1 Tax=Podospora didyma TaxID=330526 RepID=A0AAE0U6U5_9PEZI|nr:hypothetical protein B0H63DRAFT_424987 [Podospora didyma]
MAGQEEEHEGASVGEILIEACRRNNTDLLGEVLEDKGDNEIATLLNTTTTVMGNHLYHEAASRGNYEVIDMLLDQPGFECDPVNRVEGDTPLHSAIRWINSEPEAQREFGNSLIDMMLEAGSSSRIKNKGGLTPLQLVDPRNESLRELIRKHEYAALNAGDFVNPNEISNTNGNNSQQGGSTFAQSQDNDDDDDDDDAEFSGSDDEERAEWERRRRARRG